MTATNKKGASRGTSRANGNAPSQSAGPTRVDVINAHEEEIRVRDIDKILSDRIPAPPPEIGPDTEGSLRLPPADVAEGGAPPRPLGRSLGPMTAEEEVRVHTDVFGESPPEAQLRERRISELEREIGRIPAARRRALDRALRTHPLLVVVSPHTKMMLEGDDFDPVAAARRLVNYWEQREAMFGKKAFATGVFVDPGYDDYIRYYEKCKKAQDDIELEEDMRDLARDYIICVNEVKIAAVDRIVERTSDADKAALMEARELCPDVVNSAEHKMLFLESENFIEAKAAARMMKYWATKKLLFGLEKLHREISLGDVENGVYSGGYEGMFRLMAETDNSGRSILVIVVSEMARTGWTKEGMSQFLWCVLHMALSRPSCRRNGMIILADYQSGNREMYEHISPARQLFRLVLFESVPVKIRVIHCFFVPSSWWDSFMMSVISTVSTVLKKRIVFHLGISEENITIMEDRFGVQPNQIPDKLGGEVGLEWWREWVQEKKSSGTSCGQAIT